MVSEVVPEECTGGAVNVCVRLVSEAVRVVPEVVCTSAFAPVPVAVTPVPVAAAPDLVAGCDAVAKALAETCGVASAVGAVSFLAASATRLVAST